MAEATLSSAREAVHRGQLAPVYYLTGDEAVLKREFVDLVVQRGVDPATRDFNLDIRSAGDLDAEALHAMVETPPMMAERRVAVVRNVEQWRRNTKPWKMLHRYAAHPSPTTTLVVVHGEGCDPDDRLLAHSTHIAVATLAGPDLEEWIEHTAKDLGLELTPEAVEHLVATTGDGLTRLKVEIEKLAAATPEGTAVSRSHVAEMVGVAHGETPTDWVGAVLHRDTARAVALLDIVRHQSGVSGVRLLMQLGTALLGTRLAVGLAEAGRPAGRIRTEVVGWLRRHRPAGIGRYGDEASRWTAATRHWTGAELDRALAVVYDADRRLKSTTLSDERGTLYSMVLFLDPGSRT